MKVKAKTTVRYNGKTYPPDVEFDMAADDFVTVSSGILEAVEVEGAGQEAGIQVPDTEKPKNPVTKKPNARKK